MKRRLLTVITLQVALVSGCTWVKLTEGGANVTSAAEADVAGCTKVGMISAHTRDKVVVNRSSGKVIEELLVLARNEADGLGGDTIVAEGPPNDGEQDFAAYRCR